MFKVRLVNYHLLIWNNPNMIKYISNLNYKLSDFIKSK